MLCVALNSFAQPATTPEWLAIKTELEAMFKSDQVLRQEFNTFLVEARAKGIEVDKTAKDTLWARINERDGINQNRFSEIVGKYG